MNKMHWEIETKSGLHLQEGTSTFLNETKDIKKCFFTDGSICCGFDNEGHVFLNQVVIDLKIHQEILKFYQYKECQHSLFNDSETIIYYLCMDATDGEYQYKYALEMVPYRINLKAKKYDGKNLIKSRVLPLL